MTSTPDPLDPLLDRWKETPEPPPRLQAEIWRRIAIAEKTAGPEGFRAVVESWFARPPFAAMFVVSCALLGLFLAEVRVGHLQRERSQQLARSYLQLIDPLLTADNDRHP
ncbi:MAG TPA: hypothetical protein VHD32_07970 [Candidatus Didemnitutus sp.]|nr:hypothetical protein [Candidatus Didemnitutus sp.]